MSLTRSHEATSLGEAEAAEDYLESPLAMSAPSAIAVHSEVRTMQRISSHRVMNDRPAPDTNHPPIALLYYGFGRFLDFATGASMEPMLDFDQRQLEFSVDGFMASMNAYFGSESDASTGSMLSEQHF